MRLSVRHTETVSYDPPSMGTIQVMRMTPRDHTGHYVCDWSVEVDADCKIDRTKDAFGNVVTSFSLMGPLESVTITATGEVETEMHHGVVRGTMDTVPHGVFLRPGLKDSQASLVRQLAALAGSDGAIVGSALDHMHALMRNLHAALPQQQSALEQEKTTQMQAQSNREGVPHQQQQESSPVKTNHIGGATPHESMEIQRFQNNLITQNVTQADDHALLLCDCARLAGLPARLVSGYRLLEADHQNAVKTYDDRHVWSEILIEDLGWVGFDAKTNSCPSEESIRVAVGLDRHGIAPMRLGHYGTPGAFERSCTIALARISG